MGPINIRLSIFFPLYGLNITSFPYLSYPQPWTCYALSSILKGLKGVASSLNFPFKAAILPMSV
jgi:hypothetical protein